METPPHRPTSTLAIGLALAILLDTAGQLLWKWAAEALPPTPDPLSLIREAATQPLFLLVVTVFMLQLFNWLRVLDRADLSYAQPITSLSYVTVSILSALLFGETIGPLKAAGILCILFGVWIISQGNQQSSPLSGAEG
ncbi:MAG: EamA family transporter [Magnetococcus sp. XQGC-1]